MFTNHRSAEDAENVLRLNLDLRVEVETMRKELQDKDKLLRVRMYILRDKMNCTVGLVSCFL